MRHLYGTENVIWTKEATLGWRNHQSTVGSLIWAGFRPIGNTEKVLADYEQLLRTVFSCFQLQKKKKIENVVAFTLKSCISIWGKKIAPKTWKKLSSTRAKFAINCVLLYWRHLPVRLLYNDFACALPGTFSCTKSPLWYRSIGFLFIKILFFIQCLVQRWRAV